MRPIVLEKAFVINYKGKTMAFLVEEIRISLLLNFGFCGVLGIAWFLSCCLLQIYKM